MSNITISVISLDYTVDYPYVSIDVDFVVPDNIPFLGGRRYHLGGGAISLQETSIDIPFSDGPVSADIRLSLFPQSCVFLIDGWVKLDIKIYPWRWDIGPLYIPYASVFGLPEPSWSANPVLLDAAMLQVQITDASDKQVGSDNSVTPLQNDPATQVALRRLLQFFGADGLIDRMIGNAQHLASARARRLAYAAETGGDPLVAARAVEAADGDALIALAIGATGGAGFGVSGSYGLYFTSTGDFGTFGSVGINAGILVELAAGPLALFYWADAGLSATECFSGLNGYVAVDVGEGITGGLAIYWPEDAPLHVTSSVPCGIGVNVSAGFGLPVNFFAGNSETFLLQNPPPQLHGR